MVRAWSTRPRPNSANWQHRTLCLNWWGSDFFGRRSRQCEEFPDFPLFYTTFSYVFSNSQLVKRYAVSVHSKIQRHDDVAMLVNAANTNKHKNLSLPERNFPIITELMYSWIIARYHKSLIQLVKTRRRSRVDKKGLKVSQLIDNSPLTRQESVCLRPRS